MDKTQYGEWRNHPATMFFRQFLRDRAKALGAQVHESWLNGQEIHEVDRGRILELIDIEDVSFEVIENFYKEKAIDTETSENGTR